MICPECAIRFNWHQEVKATLDELRREKALRQKARAARWAWAGWGVLIGVIATLTMQVL